MLKFNWDIPHILKPQIKTSTEINILLPKFQTLMLLLLLHFFGCHAPASESESQQEHNRELVPEPDKSFKEALENEEISKKSNSNCSMVASDFLLMRSKHLQEQFFYNIDSIRKIQYPNEAVDTSILADITPYYLNVFLRDINIETLVLHKAFSKSYHFNYAPEGYSDPKVCDDDIRLYFDTSTCSFRLVLYNTFLVEPDWCTESAVIYHFKIENDRITSFGRQEAG